MSHQFLLAFRTLIIQLLNLLDDELDFERTIPPKAERRRVRLEMLVSQQMMEER